MTTSPSRFPPRELGARVKALLRRSGAPESEELHIGNLRIDLAAHRAYVGDELLQLGPTEYRLLTYLVQRPDRAFDRSQLLDRVWGRSAYVEERTVDVHVLRLRKALKAHGLEGLIETVRGVGYRLVAPPSED